MVLVLAKTFINGLFDIFLQGMCCFVDTLLETLGLVGLPAVKYLHIGLLLSFTEGERTITTHTITIDSLPAIVNLLI